MVRKQLCEAEMEYVTREEKQLEVQSKLHKMSESNKRVKFDPEMTEVRMFVPREGENASNANDKPSASSDKSSRLTAHDAYVAEQTLKLIEKDKNEA